MTNEDKIIEILNKIHSKVNEIDKIETDLQEFRKETNTRLEVLEAEVKIIRGDVRELKRDMMGTKEKLKLVQ